MPRYFGSAPTAPAFATVVASGARAGLMTGTGYKSFPGLALDTINYANRLHLVYREGSAHNSGGSTIDYKYSDDDGVTWSSPGSARILVTSTAANDVRDPFILVSSTGRIIVGYDYRSPYASLNIEVQIIYSDDGGATFTSGYVIPAVLSGTEAAGTSQPIQLAGGEILIPGTIENGGPLLSVLWKSTDDGATFPTQITIASDPSREYTEPQFRLLASGDIVCLMRSDTTQHTYRSVSTDSGATWSSPADVLTASSRPDFVEISPGLLALWCRNNNSQFYARWTYSTDAGVTWAALQNTDSATDVWMYGAPLVTSPGNVTIVYSLENSASDADLYLRRYIAV